ncbi:hypothetical protein SAMN04487944_109165 [Gracilibacillus ureilyticus]|uniref:Uncharacterized protein n=1 Tax=Gracilibacillus ureilyticus TaxID=531814 RepID=A0A1H9RTM2_9BACI|nr:hypothetical protein [Gracilibacillus ureilyticus]SER76281.1 hypothetical protein SAMN04487944_109165 [Gracilibacillus ureilyticus]
MEQKIYQMIQAIEEIKSEIQLIREALDEVDTEDVLGKLDPFMERMEEEFSMVKKDIEAQNQQIHQLKQLRFQSNTSMNTGEALTRRTSYTIPSSSSAKLF